MVQVNMAERRSNPRIIVQSDFDATFRFVCITAIKLCHFAELIAKNKMAFIIISGKTGRLGFHSKKKVRRVIVSIIGLGS